MSKQTPVALHGDLRVGRFLSRLTDGETYRQGVKDYRYFRAINYCTVDGDPLRRVCLVETRPDSLPAANDESVRAVMRVLDAGQRALASAAKTSTGVTP